VDKPGVPLRPGSKCQQIKVDHPKKVTRAKHSINLSHHIQFPDTSILAKKCEHMECLTREVIENEVHPENITGKKVSP